MLHRQLQGNRTSKGNAEDRGALEAKLLNQGGKVVRMPADVPNAMLWDTASRRGKTISPESVGDHFKPTGQLTGQGKREFPASRQSWHKHQGLSAAETNYVHEFPTKPNLGATRCLRDRTDHGPRSLPLRC